MSREKITILSILAVGGVLLILVGFVSFVLLREASGTGSQTNGLPQPGNGAQAPVGQGSGWHLAFSDEFEGASLDTAKWIDRSSAESDEGHGNKDNQQLEWNQAANCVVSGGEIAMTAKREHFTSPSGIDYGWTSCLISSTPSYAFQYGYIEERAIMPAPRGFWPALWTWQASGVNRPIETDVYEFHSDNHRELLLTQHSGAKGGCKWRPDFDPTADWHTYGADIAASGTTWYVDGEKVCHTSATSDGSTNIISNLAVYEQVPPDSGTTTAVKRVDYIRAWQRR